VLEERGGCEGEGKQHQVVGSMATHAPMPFRGCASAPPDRHATSAINEALPCSAAAAVPGGGGVQRSGAPQRRSALLKVKSRCPRRGSTSSGVDLVYCATGVSTCEVAVPAK